MAWKSLKANVVIVSFISAAGWLAMKRERLVSLSGLKKLSANENRKKVEKKEKCGTGKSIEIRDPYLFVRERRRCKNIFSISSEFFPSL